MRLPLLKHVDARGYPADPKLTPMHEKFNGLSRSSIQYCQSPLQFGKAFGLFWEPVLFNPTGIFGKPIQ
jgi:hypothetical protein